MPPLEHAPRVILTAPGNEEYQALLDDSEVGALSRGLILDDEAVGAEVVREVFCPRDYDVAYASLALLGMRILGVKWLTDSYSPDACRIESLDNYNSAYELTHSKG